MYKRKSKTKAEREQKWAETKMVVNIILSVVLVAACAYLFVDLLINTQNYFTIKM